MTMETPKTPQGPIFNQAAPRLKSKMRAPSRGRPRSPGRSGGGCGATARPWFGVWGAAAHGSEEWEVQQERHGNNEKWWLMVFDDVLTK